MEHYPTWPNLPAMMFALARTWPDKPLLRCFRDGAMAFHHLGRVRPDGGILRAAPARGRRGGRRPGGDRVGEPAGISDRRDRADGAARRAGADLRHQHGGRSRAHPARFGRAGGDRVHPCPRRHAARGGTAGGWPRSAGGDRRAADPDDAGRIAAADALGCTGGRRRTAGRHRAGGGIHSAECAGLPDLHLRHRRRAQGRDAAAPLDPVELPRRVRADAAVAAARRGVSVVSAGFAQLRTHGRPVLPAQHRHRDRLLPRRRASGGRHADGAADHPHRGAARAGGDPQPRADAGGAARRRGGRRCSGARWNSG